MTPTECARHLAALAPVGAAVGAAGIGDDGTLFAVEESAIARAVPARQAEFRAGRIAARRAFEALRAPAAPVPMATTRAPVWPRGFVGSISHAEGLAAAVVAGEHRFRGLGLDIERDAALPPDVIDEVAAPAELAGAGGRAEGAAAIFSAKEAVYKALFPLTGIVFGFDALRVDLDSGTARFDPDTCPPGLSEALLAGVYSVRQARAHGMILSICEIPR